MGSSVSKKTFIPPPQVFVLSPRGTGGVGRAKRWDRGRSPQGEVTFQLLVLPHSRETRRLCYSQASKSSKPAVHFGNGTLSRAERKKDCTEPSEEGKAASLYQKTMRGLFPLPSHVTSTVLPLEIPSPNLAFLSVQVSTSSEKPLSVCLLCSFTFYTTRLDQMKTTMRYVPLCTKRYTYFGKQFNSFLNGVTIRPSKSTPRNIPKRNENKYSQHYS